MKKWLMVLDQVGYSTFSRAYSSGTGSSPVPLSLDYLPRTTPVGHATISTGRWPSDHLIQGRVWCESAVGPVPGVHRVHRVAQLPNLYPVEGTVFEQVFATSLARQLRRDVGHANAAIVAVAAKDFIPFLFGAWDTDVSVYPRTTAPVRVDGAFVIDIVFDVFTARGDGAVRTSQGSLSGLAASLTAKSLIAASPGPWTVGWLDPVPALLGPTHVRRAMRWNVPAAWGASDAAVRRHWKAFIDSHIIDIDQFYADVAITLMGFIEDADHQIVLQSAVATDTYGHFHGPSHTKYATALSAGILRAASLYLQQPRWSVLVTSDHGGRDTPSWWNLARGTIWSGAAGAPGAAAVGLPTGRVVLEGDHAVGYAGGAPPPAIQWINWAAAPAVLAPVSVLPPGLITNSFHPMQRPDWIVLPEDTAMITDAPMPGGRGGGGSHGGCVTARGAVSSVDGEVPLWWLGTTVASPPSDLRGIASFFLTLR